MTITSDQRARFRREAENLDGVDRAVYEQCGRDPLEPIIGLGDPGLPVAIFGRDPGRDEVRHGMPFIGAGGQKVRAVLYRHRHGTEMPDFDASVAVGRAYFWANTVPYKPVGNKAWSMRVKKAFQPLMAEVLTDCWQGRDVITLGREAFLWFGINQSRAVRDALDAFWGRADRFEASHATTLTLADGRERPLRLHPLPHPSPLNATWFKRFPGLFEARLAALDPVPEGAA